MDAVIRGAVIFLFLLAIFRIAGKRTLSESTNFDFVLLLIVSEVTGQAMVANDRSMTTCMILILTLVGMNIILSVIKQRSKTVQNLIDGEPLIVMQNGCTHEERLKKERITEEDILAAAREKQGLERLDQIKFAILESDGQISIVPKR